MFLKQQRSSSAAIFCCWAREARLVAGDIGKHVSGADSAAAVVSAFADATDLPAQSVGCSAALSLEHITPCKRVSYMKELATTDPVLPCGPAATAANALGCVAVEHAWLTDPAPLAPPPAAGPAFGCGGGGSPSPYATAAQHRQQLASAAADMIADGTDGISRDGSPHADGQQTAVAVTEDVAALAAQWDVSREPTHVLSLGGLQREAALAAARAAAAAASPPCGVAPAADASDLLQQLLTLGALPRMYLVNLFSNPLLKSTGRQHQRTCCDTCCSDVGEAGCVLHGLHTLSMVRTPGHEACCCLVSYCTFSFCKVLTAPKPARCHAIAMVCAAGRVDAALALAATVLQGGELTAALQQVASHLATEAARAQLRQPAAQPAATTTAAGAPAFALSACRFFA